MLSSQAAQTQLASVLLTCAVFLSGCPDPEASFDDFNARYKKIHESGEGGAGGAGGGAGCTVPAAGEADGDFFLGLAAKINPNKPLTFVVHVKTTAMGSGLNASLTAQALKAADRKTPTGAPIQVDNVQVNADGTFVANFPMVTTPGDGNPITGSDLESKISLHGTVCKPGTFMCGTVTGNVTKPIPLMLDGSTFAMQKITDPNHYPETEINCDKDVVPLM